MRRNCSSCIHQRCAATCAAACGSGRRPILRPYAAVNTRQGFWQKKQPAQQQQRTGREGDQHKPAQHAQFREQRADVAAEDIAGVHAGFIQMAAGQTGDIARSQRADQRQKSYQRDARQQQHMAKKQRPERQRLPRRLSATLLCSRPEMKRHGIS